MGDFDSSDREWIAEFHDMLESGDSDFEEDDVDEPSPKDQMTG